MAYFDNIQLLKDVSNSYTYNENQQPLKVTMPGGETSEYTYDGLGRLTGKNISADAAMSQKYVYWSSERNAEGESLYKTMQIARETMGDFGYFYKYDDMGNIILINRGIRTGDTNVLTAYAAQAGYEYDSKGQLVRENNADLNKTIVYHYDGGGNLTSKECYPYTTADDITGQPDQTITYTYDSTWKDLLLSYDDEDITYDEIGNPLEYRGADLDWQGRELKSFTKDGTTISYTYGTDGIRTKKVVGNEVHEYYYSSGLLAYEKRGNLQFYYTYDHEGNLCRIRYINASGQSEYYYPAVNIRGDVQAIFDETGALEAEYVYDAWGNTISIKDANGTEITSQSNIGHLNRIRYRGYYYDAESELYYLGTRYYDSEVGRFLSADSAISNIGGDVRGYNLYAYSFNNPVNMLDATGTWPKWVEKAAKVVSVVVAVVAVGLMVAAVSAFTAGTGSAAAIYGASILLGAALSGLNGAVANSKKGNSYFNGYCGGATGGTLQALFSKTPGGVVIGGGAGVTIGTAVTDILNNLDPDSLDSTKKEMFKNAATSGLKALATSSVTSYAGYAADMAKVNGAGGLMPSFTYGFAEGVKAFFGWADDAVIYVWE